MEQDFELFKAKVKTSSSNGKTRKKNMKRCIALLLSAVLAAGTCLPAMAAEQPEIQEEEASSAASTDIEQAVEEQPAEGGKEVVTIETPEENVSEDIGSSEGEADQTGPPADDNPETTIDTAETASTEIADSTESAADALTSDTAESAPEEEPDAAEEPKNAVEPEGAILSESSESGNPEGDATWLNNYNYSITEMYDGTQAVVLQNYNGADNEIEVPGSVQIDGVTYPVTANSSRVWENDFTKFTVGAGFVLPENCGSFFSDRYSLISVDLSQADTSRVTSMNGMFNNCSNLIEVNLDNNDDSNVDDVGYMFNGCINLERLNLSGWDWAQIYYNWGVFEGCDNLEELITPANVNCTIELPHIMTDQNGNVFSNLPMSSGSVTLQIFETTGWLEDYVFYTDSENGIIILQEYTGSDSELTVPESVSVGGRDYLVKVYAGTWRSGITSLTLEGSDPFYDYLSTNFGDMRDLEVLDLRKVNCTKCNYQYLQDCIKLKTIYLPSNCQWEARLPRVFKDENGNHYSVTPTGLSNNIRLDAVTCSKWLEDYTYTINKDDNLELTRYFGDQKELVIPGTAEVDGKTYNEILVQHNRWDNGVTILKFENGVKTGYPISYRVFSTDEMFCYAWSLESIDFSETGDIIIANADGMFRGCSNLKTVDLSGLNMMNCASAEGFFDQCDSLETITAPAHVACSIELPAAFSDENGRVYTEIPINLDKSITLTRVQASNWLSDYKYIITEDSIVLLQYKKEFLETYDEETGTFVNNASVTVPGKAEIGEEEYDKIVLSENIWAGKGIRELYFEQGVSLPEDCSNLFSYESLEKIDLSLVDVTGAANMLTMFKNCDKLSTIVVPKAVSLEARLPGMFVDENENYYSTLPVNMSESFTITKDNQNEWLGDYDYYIDGDKVVLTGYHGLESNLVVQGSAVFGNTTYSTIGKRGSVLINFLLQMAL